MIKSHGDYFIRIEGNIVFISLEGSMNEYSVKELFFEAKTIINNFNGNKFSMLSNLSKIIGGTPEAYDEANKFNEWLNTQNMVAKAVVITSPTLSKIERIRVPAKLLQNIKEFDNEPDAIKWLKTQL